jgi:signal transduction histidine kinase
MMGKTNTDLFASALTVDFEELLGELLAEKERLAEIDHEKSALLSRAVHDLRGPITALNLHVYLLERGKPEDRDKYMASLRETIAELSRMVNDLLSITHVGETPDDIRH